MNNLKQVNLGFLMYADAHGQKYPMEVTAENGGTMEFIHTDHVFPHFEKLQKYLTLSQLVCPTDKRRFAATNFNVLTDLSISYFLNVDASLSNAPAKALLGGDRNLSVQGTEVKEGLLYVTAETDMNWFHSMHLRGGNLMFADGHIEWNATNRLNSVFAQQPIVTNRIVVP